MRSLNSNNIAVLRNANLIGPAEVVQSEQIEPASPADIRQLKRRISSTTHGRLSMVSGLEKFKCDLAASLKLFFIWDSKITDGCNGNHVFAKCANGGYEPKCKCCGELIYSSEDLKPQNA